MRIISAEPALAARLLQLANSAALNSSGTPHRRPAPGAVAHRLQHGAQRDHRLRDVAAAPRRSLQGSRTAARRAVAVVGAHRRREPRGGQAFHRASTPTPRCSAGLLGGIGKLYLLTRAARFPGVLGDAGHLPAHRRRMARAHRAGHPAQLGDRRGDRAWRCCACENHDREHEGATDLTDVLAVGSAMAALGPSPVAEQMLFLGMPAARRMKLDAAGCMRRAGASRTTRSSPCARRLASS